MASRDVRVRVIRPGEKPPADEVRMLQPAERIAMMWSLAVDAWAFKGEPVGESRLPRHTAHILRRGC
jgi:hypothetical protein